MRVLRIILAILVLLVLIAVVALALLYYFMDPNDLKPVLIKEVKRQTGYQLAIPGKLSWTFYPQLGIKVERMTLAAPHASAAFVELGGVNIATTWSQIRHGSENLKGDIYIATVKLLKLNLQNAHIGLHWQNNALTLQPIVAKLYGGSLSGVAHGSEFSATPKWDWNVQFSSVKLQPLLDDVNGTASKIKLTGVGNIKLQAATAGKSQEQMLNNLRGTTDFSLQKGAVEGIDVNYLVVLADALINKEPIPTPANINETAFENLIGTAVIGNGSATTNNLTLTSAAFLIKGQGKVNLLSQELAFDLQVKSQQTIKTQWEIPIMITGDLQHPNVRLDMREIEKLIAKTEIEKVKDRVQEEIKKRVPGKAGEILQNFLGR